MNLAQNLLKKAGGLHLLHKTLMAQDAQAVLKDNRAANRKHGQIFQTGKKGTAPTSATQDEDMGIHVGDVHKEIHYHGGTTEQTIAQKGSSVLKKAAIGAALIGTGVAAPYALPLVGGLLKGDRPVVEAPKFDDTDTSVELEITGGE